MGGQRDCNGSGTGADVGDLQRLVRWQELQDSFDHEFGLRSWDKDGGGHREGQAVELLLPGDVLDGLIPQTPVNRDFVADLLIGREFASRISEKGNPGDIEGVEKQEFGIARGLPPKMFIRGKPGGGGGEGFTERDRVRV